MSRISHVTISEVHFMAYKLADELMRWDEPFPDFSTRFPNILESCIDTPFQTFNKKPLYTGLIGKASAMFYFMIKNHPFQNGNKRIAVTTVMMFLYKNGRWIRVSNQKLYEFAVKVAESKASDRGAVMKGINFFIKKNIISRRY